jgi:hypothetical protein
MADVMARLTLKYVRWWSAFAILTTATPAAAIILDCKQNLDGTYTCVEIGKPSAAETASPAQDEAATIQRAYIERAREFCTYRKPRTRAGGKASTSALKMEAMKSAQEDYERCVAAKAAELQKADQTD